MFSLALLLSAVGLTDTSTLAADSPATALDAPSPSLRIVGHRAVPAGVYRAILRERLDLEPPFDPVDARRACDATVDLLEEAGYPYAVAWCRDDAERLVVVVDEGTIERVAFPGQSGLTAVAANVVFDLEHRVFQRASFAREVERLERTLDTRVTGWELIRTSSAAPSSLQVSELVDLESVTGIEPGGRYVLVLHLRNEFLAPGFGFGLEATGPDGLITELRYRWKDVFGTDDRLQSSAEVGLRITDLIGDDEPPPLVSRAGLGVSWYSARLSGGPFRASGSVRGRYLNRQRRDLADSSYDLVEPEGALGLLWRAGEYRQATLRMGVDYRSLVASDLGSTDAEPRTTGFVRAFFELDASVALFQPKTQRLDHSLQLRGRARGYATERPYAALEATVEKGFPVGRYNDLRLEGRGVGLVGGFGIIDEVRVSDLFRGLYGDRLYTSRIGSLSSEFFLSLERNRLRASVFLDGLVYDPSQFANDGSGARPGIASGVGLHALFFETFQGSIYGLLGVADGQRLRGGFNLSLARVF